MELTDGCTREPRFFFVEAPELSAAVLLCPAITERILSNFTVREAAQCRAVCCAWKSMVDDLQRRQKFKIRVLVSSSGNRKVLEVDADNGTVLQQALAFKKRKRSSGWHFSQQKAMGSWHTGMCISPYTGDLYVCQYKVSGVLQFHCGTLQYKKVFAAADALACPEGIAFAHGCAYVASAAHGHVVCVDACTGKIRGTLSCGRDAVPWGLTVGPDGAVYVAVDVAFESDSYAEPPPSTTTGTVLRCAVDDSGMCSEASVFVAPTGLLRRPSGICFDAAGHLYVTSMTNQVLRFEGPGSATPGALRDVFIEGAPDELMHPWDVQCRCSLFFVTTHTARDSCRSAAINVYDTSGKLLRKLSSPLFKQPNMLVLQ